MRFSNVEAFDLYMSIHSAFVEMCTARDYLAQFAARRVFGGIKIETMHELVKKLSQSGQWHELADEIGAICDRSSDDGWMARLSRFRNIVVHQTPISSLSDERGMKAKEIHTEAGTLRVIVVAIPRDPISPDGNFVDALSCVRFLHAKLTAFSKRIAGACGLSAETPILTDADLAR